MKTLTTCKLDSLPTTQMGAKVLALDMSITNLEVPRGLEPRRTSIRTAGVDLLKTVGRIEMCEENAKLYAKDVGRVLLRLGEIRLLLASLSQHNGVAPDRLADTLRIMNELELLARTAKAKLDRPWAEPTETSVSEPQPEPDLERPQRPSRRHARAASPSRTGKTNGHSGAAIAGIAARLQRQEKPHRKGSS